ncbi:MAG: Flp pilus assembly protein CpaB [Gemmatimonadota bacterium]|nr:Flp pilus assembly protein CpaB [Gemmatimonadota bacterium]
MADRRPTFRTILFFAVFVGLVAVLGAFKALQMTGLGAGMRTQRIVVATREIPEGAVIDRVAVSTAEWPRATLPAGAFSSVDSVVGRITRVAVFSGDPIVPARLAPAGSGPGLEVKITAGKRAMSVRINDVAGISGLIQPNSRVDVLVTLRTDALSQRQVAKVFMENMRVLSVGRQMERDGEGEPIDATTATLEVTPDEAERLAVAMNQGSIQLVLRGYGDPSNVTTSGASSTDVLAQLRSARTAQLPATDVRPRARGPRRAIPRPAPVSPTPDPAAAAVRAPLAIAPPLATTPARPDSSVVRVYRGNELVVKKFEKTDSAGPRKP